MPIHAQAQLHDAQVATATARRVRRTSVALASATIAMAPALQTVATESTYRRYVAAKQLLRISQLLARQTDRDCDPPQTDLETVSVGASLKIASKSLSRVASARIAERLQINRDTLSIIKRSYLDRREFGLTCGISTIIARRKSDQIDVVIKSAYPDSNVTNFATLQKQKNVPVLVLTTTTEDSL